MSAVASGTMLVQLYRQSSIDQIARAEAVTSRACDEITNRYRFHTTGWTRPPDDLHDEALRKDLLAVLAIVWPLDPDRMQQALDNLVLNAIQSMPKGGIVTIAAEERAGRLQLRVTDDGPGLPAQVRLHLFEPFVSARADGTGLGLSIVREIALAHGGTVSYRPENPGSTIFMATRSTGQIEEGPPGFSIAAIDGRTISWRFKPLDQAWPFVLVAQPADRRLATDAGQVVRDAFAVCAKVLGDAPIISVEAQVDDGGWVPMVRAPGENALWEAWCEAPGNSVRVRARDANKRADQDTVEPARPGWTVPEGAGDGSDRDRVGAWPERGILDTQLGPNRNGKKW